MGFNLNNAGDFAKLTLSSASGILNALTGASADSWDIEEGAYGHPAEGSGPAARAQKNLLSAISGFAESVAQSVGLAALPGAPEGFVLFHVFKSAADYAGAVDEVRDTGGRRKVPFEYPYMDGQSTEDLGRKGESFSINILIFGTNYKKAYKKLLEEFNNPVPGTLIHPVRGRIRCVASDWEITHKADSRQAVAIRVTFLEHNFEFSFTEASETTKSALSSAIDFLSKITNVVNKVEANIAVVQSFKNQFAAIGLEYQALYQDNLVRLNKTFNTGQSDDLPGIVPTSTGDLPDTFTTGFSPTDAFAGLDETALDATTIAALAAQQAIDEIRKLREMLNEVIAFLTSANGGQGSVIFYDEILELKRSGIAIQESLEVGIRSSNATIISYKVPRVMSLREVCFDNGIPVDRVYELEVLNPGLLSTNFIEKGSVLKVPQA